MTTAGLSLLVTVLILNLHHKTHKAPVRRWVRKILRLNEVNTRKVTDGVEETSGAPGMGSPNNRNRNDGAEQNRKKCRLSLHEEEAHKTDNQWKVAIRRIDRISFSVFFFIFIALDVLLILTFSYGDTTHLNREDCTI